MADDKSPKSIEKEDSAAGSEDESVDDREEVLLLDSESEDDSDSERKPEEPGPVRQETRDVPAIDPRIDMSLSDIVGKQAQKDVKRYENKNRANFVTGFDVSSKESRKKREDRKKRFGTEKKEDQGEKEEDISSVLLAPGSKIGGHPVRFEALHMTGLDDMSTQDVFSYFQSYDPSSIEWINDTSCNIVWLDPHSAARALLGMSKPSEGYFKLGLKNLAQSRHLIDPDPIPEPSLVPEVEQESEPMEEGGDEDEDALDLVSDLETGEKVRPPSPRTSPMTISTHSNYASKRDKEERMEGMETMLPGDEDLGPVDITYDQALRLGTPHPKAEHLIMRYATQNDMKLKGAYKQSQYYIKYGNPNFGGMKGLLSETMRKKIRTGKYQPSQARKRRFQEDSDEEREEEREEWPRKRRVPGRMERRLGERESFRPQLSPPHRSGSDGESGEDEEEEEQDLEAEVRHALREREDEGTRTKMSRRMYADEIEDQIKKIRSTIDTKPKQSTQQVVADARERLRQGGRGGSRPSIKSRLGGGGGIMGAHSFTPAPSMENLKVILDVNEQVSDQEEAWANSSGEDNDADALVVGDEDEFDDDEDDDAASVDTYFDDGASVDSRDAHLGGVSSDLRSRLSRREASPAPALRPPTRPGFGPSKSRPAFLENLPSLQIEIREDS